MFSWLRQSSLQKLDFLFSADVKIAYIFLTVWDKQLNICSFYYETILASQYRIFIIHKTIWSWMTLKRSFQGHESEKQTVSSQLLLLCPGCLLIRPKKNTCGSGNATDPNFPCDPSDFIKKKFFNTTWNVQTWSFTFKSSSYWCSLKHLRFGLLYY